MNSKGLRSGERIASALDLSALPHGVGPARRFQEALPQSFIEALVTRKDLPSTRCDACNDMFSKAPTVIDLGVRKDYLCDFCADEYVREMGEGA